MNINPPPIGTLVTILRDDGDWLPYTMDAIVATGEVSEPADCACACVVKGGGRYFLVRDAANINPSKERVRTARVRWATSVLARASRLSMGVYEPNSMLAERVLRGEE